MAILAVTPLEVAFVSAIATAVAAAAGPFVSYLVAREGRRHERTLAWETRSYEPRDDSSMQRRWLKCVVRAGVFTQLEMLH